MKRTIATLSLALIALAAATTSACGDDDDDTGPAATGTQTQRPAAEAFELSAEDFAFSPEAIELEPGHSLDIKLTNDGNAPHTFTLDEFNIDIEVAPGDEAEIPLTASEPGQFTFYCKYHDSAGMTGTLRIGVPEGDEADATDSAGSSTGSGTEFDY